MWVTLHIYPLCDSFDSFCKKKKKGKFHQALNLTARKENSDIKIMQKQFLSLFGTLAIVPSRLFYATQTFFLSFGDSFNRIQQLFFFQVKKKHLLIFIVYNYI